MKFLYIFKNIVFVVLFALGSAASNIEAAAVYYYTGRVSSFSDNTIALENNRYLIKHNAVYLKHVKRKDAFYEEKSRASQLRIGDSVVLHVNGTIVDKVIIEEWKR